MKPHIRVDLTVAGHTSRVWFIDREGKETEISHMVTGLDISAEAKGFTTASLHVFGVAGSVLAELEEVTST